MKKIMLVNISISKITDKRIRCQEKVRERGLDKKMVTVYHQLIKVIKFRTL